MSERLRTIKQGASAPPLTGRLTFDRGRQFMDLGPGSRASALELRARGVGTATLIIAPASILDDGTLTNRGRWSWAFTAADTAVPDIYSLEFAVTYGPGEVEIVPDADYGQFRITPSLV